MIAEGCQAKRIKFIHTNSSGAVLQDLAFELFAWVGAAVVVLALAVGDALDALFWDGDRLINDNNILFAVLSATVLLRLLASGAADFGAPFAFGWAFLEMAGWGASFSCSQDDMSSSWHDVLYLTLNDLRTMAGCSFPSLHSSLAGGLAC